MLCWDTSETDLLVFVISQKKDLVVRSYTEYDNTRYLVMPTAREFFSSLQSQKTTSLQDFWSFYHNPQSPVNKVKLARIRDAPDAEVNATEKIFQSWMRKKARMFLIRKNNILPILGMSTWELKKPAQSNSPDAMRCTRMYEHIRDSLLLHFQSVLLMFTFIPDLCKYLFCSVLRYCTVQSCNLECS